MTEQAKTPHETTALRETLLRIASDMASNAISGSSSVSTEGFMLVCQILREAEAHLADLSARLRAREEEIQTLKDTLARRDEHTQSERQPAAPTGIALIAAERQRQIQAEGWSAEHDDQYQQAELVQAAICYAEEGGGFSLDIQTRKEDGSPTLWPWKSSWWKPKDLICNLARAGALIAAELDRQLRADQPPSSDARPTDSELGKATGSATTCLSCTATLARVTALEAEIASLKAERDDYREDHEDRRRNLRALDVAMHGEAGAAESPSACDLIGPARQLRARAEAAEARADAAEQQIRQLREMLSEAVDAAEDYRIYSAIPLGGIPGELGMAAQIRFMTARDTAWAHLRETRQQADPSVPALPPQADPSTPTRDEKTG